MVSHELPRRSLASRLVRRRLRLRLRLRLRRRHRLMLRRRLGLRLRLRLRHRLGRGLGIVGVGIVGLVVESSRSPSQICLSSIVSRPHGVEMSTRTLSARATGWLHAASCGSLPSPSPPAVQSEAHTCEWQNKTCLGSSAGLGAEPCVAYSAILGCDPCVAYRCPA